MEVEYDIRSPITSAEWDSYYQLRWRILRMPWGQPLGSEKDADEDSAIHRFALFKDEVVGVGRVHFVREMVAQVRYMATVEQCRKKGIGTAILKALEEQAQSAGAAEIVLNAREQYLDFYLGLGYTIVGDGPTLFSSIKHKRLIKKL